MARKLNSTPAPAPTIGHNSEAVEEANRVQYLSIMSKLDVAEAEIEEAAAVVKAKRKVRSQVIGLAKMAGIAEWELKRRQDELKRSPSENATNIAREGQQRRWSGIITPEQLKAHLEPGTPQEARDAMDYQSEGYKIGALGRAATLPEGIPPRFHQEWLRGHADGWKSYLLTLAENAPGAQGRAAEVAEQARKDWEKDHEPGTPEYAAAERAAVRKAKDSLANIPPLIEDADPLGVNDGFELTEAELAAIQEANASDAVV